MDSFNLNEDELLSAGIAVKNIVAKLDLDVEFELSYLASKIPNSSYEPEQYPSLVFRPPGLSTVLVTRTGKLLFTGGDSTESLRDTYRRISDELEKIGVDDVGRVDEIEIVNVVSTFELDSGLDLNYLSIALGLENIEYEPEQFPGLVYRIEDGPVVLIFSSGKVVVTGAESTSEILDAVSTTRELISD
ncbi:TATA-box-binding protein [Halobacterium salinarum]|uniref:TATA-box-binding protein n=1 Tax=Halobacterium salinarum TaxID=2242 RepID=UPI002557602E|nr:TATA-box-binding protein [Halobacterium salinarum]MDL0125899.1 TATA-box-binding protein [Halobacterium salinarum]